VDYSRSSATAQRLVEKAGRAIALIQLNDEPTDSTKSWRGNSAPRDVPLLQLNVKAVFVAPSAASRQLGASRVVSDLLSSCEQVCIIATTEPLEKYNEIIDTDGTTWKIKTVQRLAPGPTTILYYVGVAR
jgi:hypothetical protein